MRKWANPEIICGIYEIKNIKNEMSYIGASEDVYKRMYDHKTSLKANHHPNIRLQGDWNKYGEIF